MVARGREQSDVAFPGLACGLFPISKRRAGRIL
jgi:hypothetical protein